MSTRVAINGFGRIGRLSFRNLLEKPDLEVVAINDLTSVDANAHLFKYDSTYGIYPGSVEALGDSLVVHGRPVKITAMRDPAKLPWDDLGIDLVVESTGFFTDAAKAAGHLEAGAKRVVISAPAKGPDITVVMGVNHEQYDPAKDKIISNASCTTNCLVPVAKVLFDTFGIVHGMMTTVHAATNDQRVQDQFHEDPRRARSTLNNIIPTKTGAATAAELVIPELKGKFRGFSLRVPTNTVSVVDFVVELERSASLEEVNRAFKGASSEGPLKGYLGYNELPLVSADYKGDPRSSIVDGLSTMVIGATAKVISWYDNEWGYSNRIADLCSYIAQRGA